MTATDRQVGLNLVGSVHRALVSGGLAGHGARLLVGVSGGPDSTALLASLVELRDDCRFELHVVHVDHGLRPESRGDAEYVRRLCGRWNVAFNVSRANVKELRRAEGLSMEAAARKARHTALLEEATASGADVIALGHTADDQVETVLLSLLRGAGLRGLAGMAEQSESPFTLSTGERVPILRPLLGVTRADVMGYLRKRGLRPRQDVSNTDPAHLRNRVRHELLPLMERIREGASDAVGRASEDARLALEYVESQAEELWQEACEITADRQSVCINRGVMRGAHAALRHVVVERAITSLLGSTQGFSRRNYRDIDAMITTGRTRSEIDLPKGLRLACGDKRSAVLSIDAEGRRIRSALEKTRREGTIEA